MGKYNFDEIIDRHGTSCNKWEYNIPEDVILQQLRKFAKQCRNV